MKRRCCEVKSECAGVGIRCQSYVGIALTQEAFRIQFADLADVFVDSRVYFSLFDGQARRVEFLAAVLRMQVAEVFDFAVIEELGSIGIVDLRPVNTQIGRE
jgi:hypothetical protein